MWWILAGFVLGIFGPGVVGLLLTIVGLGALCLGNVGVRAISSRNQKALT